MSEYKQYNHINDLIACIPLLGFYYVFKSTNKNIKICFQTGLGFIASLIVQLLSLCLIIEAVFKN